MATFKNEVTAIQKLSNAKGPYLELTIKKDDGKEIQKNVFGEAVKDFTIPGLYEVVNSKNSQGYWVIDSATLLMEAPNGSKMTQEAPKDPLKTVREVFAPKRASDQSRAILLQVCLKSACEVYHGSGGKHVTESANKFLADQITLLAGKLLSWAEKNSQNTIEEVPF